METINSYCTKDFYQACVLKALGFNLLRLDRQVQGFSVFVFSDEEARATEVIKGYWDRTLMIEPRSLVDSINELKTRLYS